MRGRGDSTRSRFARKCLLAPIAYRARSEGVSIGRRRQFRIDVRPPGTAVHRLGYGVAARAKRS